VEPDLTQPIILNVTLNAALLQPPQPWWNSGTIMTSIAAIVVVYLTHQLKKSYEKGRDIRKAWRQAYYKYIEVFSDAGRRKGWTPSLVSEKLPILWTAALEAGVYGDIGNQAFDVRLDEVLDVENDPLLETDLRSRLRIFYYYCKINENGFIEIKSFYGFIELIEAVFVIDPAKIKIDYLIEVGQSYFPILRRQLLSEAPMAHWWKIWRRKKDFTIFRLPLDEATKAKSWWQFWK
jgi:hypothetical protein